MSGDVRRFPKANQITLPKAEEKPLPIVLLDWRPVHRGTLRGFAKVLLGRSLMISDVTLSVAANGRVWAGLPSRPIIVDGKHAIGTDGKPRWQPLLEWASDTARNRFSDGVVRAVCETYPDALGDPS